MKKFDIKKFVDFNKLKKMDKKKLAIYLLIGALATGSLVYFVSHGAKKEQLSYVSVSAESSKIEDLNVKANFIGKIRTAESVTLSAEVVGKIIYMKKDGVLVEKGELIVELDPTEAKGRYMMAKGARDEEKYKLDNILALYKENYRTKSHVAEQQAKFDSAEGRLLEAEAHLNKHRIRAPFRGVIGLQNQSIGATVSQNSKLITITNVENLQVEFVIPEAELRNIGGIENLKNAGILVTVEGSLVPVQAKFAAFETVIDSETNAISVRAWLEKNDEIKNLVPGQIVKVILNVSTKENVVTVPESAVETSQGVSTVYKVINGIAVQMAVKTGIKDGERIEIISGVDEGDMIITSGQFRLSDGQKVKIEDEAK